MWELWLERDGATLLRKTITCSPFTCGRDPDNHLPLLDETISRIHCRIEQHHDALTLYDLSRNGTLVNGKSVNEIELHAGDIISMGGCKIRVEQALPKNQETVAATTTFTHVLAFQPLAKTLHSRRWRLLISEAGSSQEKKVEVTSAIFHLGHDASNDLALRDPYISRRHCSLHQQGDQLLLTDLGSSNGTIVDGIRIQQTMLKDTNEFVIGKTHIRVLSQTYTEILSPSRDKAMGQVIGQSESMRDIFAAVKRIAPSPACVCIEGESGTGKEMLARLIHENSHVAKGPFVAINCGALPETLIEGMLFGHERGAFTGAVEKSVGFFEQAHGGTLFLDEIGEMPLELQTRLLRVLEEKKIQRLGGRQEIYLDVRIISATNKSMLDCVEAKTFREDLFYRLAIVPLFLPALRKRPEDIPLLSEHFMKIFSPPEKSYTLSPSALEKLMCHAWPGNIRELKNTLQRSLLLTNRTLLTADDIRLMSTSSTLPVDQTLVAAERSAIIDALKRHHGNQSKAAQELGIARTTLSAKMKKLDLSVMKKDED